MGNNIVCKLVFSVRFGNLTTYIHTYLVQNPILHFVVVGFPAKTISICFIWKFKEHFRERGIIILTCRPNLILDYLVTPLPFPRNTITYLYATITKSQRGAELQCQYIGFFLFLLCVTKICHIKLQALDEKKHFLLITVVALLLSCITFGVTINDPMSTDIWANSSGFLDVKKPRHQGDLLDVKKSTII